MKLFTTFFLYLLAGLALYFLGLLFKKKFPAACRIFFFAAPASTLVSNLITLIKAEHFKLPAWVMWVSSVVKWLDLTSLVLLGYGLGYLIDSLSQSKNSIGPDRRYSIFLIRGLSIQLGIAFIGGAVEQYNDVTDILKFFLTSGYTGWFMHLILCIELAGGILLLFRLRFYSKLSTVTILLAVMVGAMCTHFKRGDPFNYAIASMELAVKCLILLLIILPLRLPFSSPRSTDRIYS